MAVGQDGGMWRRPTSADQRRVNYLVECHVWSGADEWRYRRVSAARQRSQAYHATLYQLAHVVLYYDWPQVMTRHTRTVILGLGHVVLKQIGGWVDW